jgi:hypothetical protein
MAEPNCTLSKAMLPQNQSVLLMAIVILYSGSVKLNLTQLPVFRHRKQMNKQLAEVAIWLGAIDSQFVISE